MVRIKDILRSGIDAVRPRLYAWLYEKGDADEGRPEACSDSEPASAIEVTESQRKYGDMAVQWLQAGNGPETGLPGEPWTNPAIAPGVDWYRAYPIFAEQRRLLQFALACAGHGPPEHCVALAHELLCAWYAITPNSVPGQRPSRGGPIRVAGGTDNP